MEVLCITVFGQVRKDTCLVGAHSFASRSRSSCGQFRISQQVIVRTVSHLVAGYCADSFASRSRLLCGQFRISQQVIVRTVSHLVAGYRADSFASNDKPTNKSCVLHTSFILGMVILTVRRSFKVTPTPFLSAPYSLRYAE